MDGLFFDIAQLELYLEIASVIYQMGFKHCAKGTGCPIGNTQGDIGNTHFTFQEMETSAFHSFPNSVLLWSFSH